MDDENILSKIYYLLLSKTFVYNSRSTGTSVLNVFLIKLSKIKHLHLVILIRRKSTKKWLCVKNILQYHWFSKIKTLLKVWEGEKNFSFLLFYLLFFPILYIEIYLHLNWVTLPYYLSIPFVITSGTHSRHWWSEEIVHIWQP